MVITAPQSLGRALRAPASGTPQNKRESSDAKAYAVLQHVIEVETISHAGLMALAAKRLGAKQMCVRNGLSSDSARWKKRAKRDKRSYDIWIIGLMSAMIEMKYPDEDVRALWLRVMDLDPQYVGYTIKRIAEYCSERIAEWRPRYQAKLEADRNLAPVARQSRGSATMGTLVLMGRMLTSVAAYIGRILPAIIAASGFVEVWAMLAARADRARMNASVVRAACLTVAAIVAAATLHYPYVAYVTAFALALSTAVYCTRVAQRYAALGWCAVAVAGLAVIAS